MAEINITPFTDVLLVLLIIFMILAALVAPPGFQRQFGCNATDCGSRNVTPPPKRVEVTVTPNGEILIAGRATDARRVYADLRAAVFTRAGARPRPISVEADVKAPYGTVLRVLDAAKADGDPDVTFVTD